MKKIVLFGAGNLGKKVEGIIHNRSGNVLFCDNNIELQGTSIAEISIVGFAQILQMYHDNEIDKIVITCYDFQSILNQCIMNGIEDKDIYFFDEKNECFRRIDERFSCLTYSQDGEELYLHDRFRNKQKGFYVDVGANHPFRFSNTYWAYQQGWRGINVEPDNLNFELISRVRREDININCGISDVEGTLSYYEFAENALNTFCKEEIKHKEDIVGIREVPVRRLDSIFEEYSIKKIDYIDIDVEGMEIQVLKSIDWNKVTIECILVEQKGMNLADILNSEVCEFLNKMRYLPVNKFDRTVIYEKIK